MREMRISRKWTSPEGVRHDTHRFHQGRVTYVHNWAVYGALGPTFSLKCVLKARGNSCEEVY